MALSDTASDTASDVGFTIERLSPALGAEVTGLDLARPLSSGELSTVKAAFQEHHMLCFRDQRLSDAELVAFSLQFGDLEEYPEKDKTKGRIEVYNVANVSSDGQHLPVDDQRVIYQRNNARWHTDSSYRFTPSLASIMYGLEVLPDEAEGGETAFSNMLEAYAALPDDLKRRIEPLHMVHYYDCIRRLEPAMPPTDGHEREALPPVTHPLVRVHPDRGGQRSLYFTCNTGREIGGGSLEEGQALHDRLREHVGQSRFCYHHRWRQYDLVIWDNRCLLHRAVVYDTAKYRRVLHRTTVAGTGPVIGPAWPDAGT